MVIMRTSLCSCRTVYFSGREILGKMAQTIENSFHSTSNDMGASHVKIHENQHTRLVDGEPLIETLTANKPTDESFDLMKKMAVKHR